LRVTSKPRLGTRVAVRVPLSATGDGLEPTLDEPMNAGAR
jgi:hypothetical protein